MTYQTNMIKLQINNHWSLLMYYSNVKKHRLTSFNQQSGLCYYCESHMWQDDIERFAEKYDITVGEAKRFQCTAEHLTARRDGGKDSKNNIAAACSFCNTTRHKRKNPPSPDKYKSEILKRIRKGKWHPRKLHHVIAL